LPKKQIKSFLSLRHLLVLDEQLRQQLKLPLIVLPVFDNLTFYSMDYVAPLASLALGNTLQLATNAVFDGLQLLVLYNQ